MLHVYEFEVFEGGQGLLAFPYDLEGGTQGEDFGDVCGAAADWLQSEMEERHLHGLPFPEPTFGNAPRHGGRTIVVAVRASKDTVPRVSAARAARMLGVTPGRVSQMIAANLLEAFRDDDGRHVWITVASVEARLAEHPGPGRPRLAKAAVRIAAG